ncbi:MAG: type II secretion system inner membrane protein GspF [Alphaproteobacteria bacterium]|nr:type II secretion system inner membrane protein GspF [Alphaproteobacteria bacterium]
MAAFEYKGFDKAGAAVAGIVDSDSARGARTKLRKQGVFPTDVWQQKAGKRGAARGKGLNVEIDFSRFFSRVGLKDVSQMTSQLSTLVGAGIPMVEALTALIEQTDHPTLHLVLVEIREKVNEGHTLADAMKEHPRIFSDLFVNMVRAGEQSGALDIVLKRLTEYTESQVKLRGELRSALTYPLLMGAVSFFIVMGLFVGVIPRIKRIFDTFGGSLPLPTKVILTLSDFMVDYWWLIIIVLGGSIFGFVRWTRTPKGRRRWHDWQLRMPVFGRINRLVAVSRFCRTMSTLLDSGVPILTAVTIVKSVVGNDVLTEAIENAGKNIREGESIAKPLKASGQFPPLVTHMIAIGERTGELEPMLGKVADAYDQEVENTVGTLTSLLEPILILTLGGVVVVVALSILLPMLNMSSIVR